MHGIIWFHALPCMESYDSMRGIAWRSVGHGSMHGIVWNHTDHMLPCMELHRSLMNLDPGAGGLNSASVKFKTAGKFCSPK